MKKNRILFYAFLGISMLLGFAACTKDSSSDKESDGRMTFSSKLVSTKTTDVGLQTSQIAEGVKVGVFVEGTATSYQNSLLTADGTGGFTSEADMKWKNESVNIYAYAPYDAGWTDISSPKEFTVASDQSTDVGYLASDLLVGAPASNPVSPTDESVSLAFAHKLAKLNVEIVNHSDISLAGATLKVLNVLCTTTVDVKTGELTAASGTAADIKMAVFASDAAEFKASAIVVPQTLAAGSFLQIETSDKALVASLSSEVTFQANKKYTYTIQIGEDGSVSLLLGSTLGAWEDGTGDLGGSAEEVVTYLVGDYVRADGTFVKASEVASMTDDQKKEIAGVIFSTEVSETDAAAGYDGYAMSVWGRKGSQVWCSLTGDAAQLVGTAVSSTSVAFADLDGLSFATDVKKVDASYAYYTAFNFANYSNQRKTLTGANLSEWYVPSLGQMALILNNLAGAEIDLTADYELTGGGEYTDELHSDIVDKLNAYITAVNDTEYADFETSNQFFATATERDATMIWGIKLTASGYVIASKAAKVNTGRNIAPVFAYKLPVE